MRKPLVLEALILYVAMAVLLVGLVHAGFMWDEDLKVGDYTATKAYVSGSFSGGKVHSPFFRNIAWNESQLPEGILCMEYLWIAMPDGVLRHYTVYDHAGNGYLKDEKTYYDLEPTQVMGESRAGYYVERCEWDTGWALAAIPLTP